MPKEVADNLSAVTVTRLLRRAGGGDRQASAELLPLVYRELRALAAKKMRQERPDQTLQATALVHEAYLRLVDHPLKTCLFSPLDSPDAKNALEAADQNLRLNQSPYFASDKGIAEYRAGNFGEAMKWLARGGKGLDDLITADAGELRESRVWDEARTTNGFLMAICAYRLGDVSLARSLHSEARDRLRARVAPESSGRRTRA